MTAQILTTPVLLIVFNRPDVTQKVFNELRKARPAKLFISADGPRADRKDDQEKCRLTRDIIKQVDWECELFTNFYDKNLGCKVAVSSGINWFFENVEEGIILEDDCLPSQSFFSFCQELLNYYNNDQRVMHIGGANFQQGNLRGEETYYFSKISHVWGWASWRRAWKYYDVNINNFPKFKDENLITNIFESEGWQKYWINNLQKVYDGKVDTWDYQWAYTVMAQNGLAAISNKNLISNIGFGEEATHTKDSGNDFSELEKFEIDKIKHPVFILQNKQADNFTYKKLVHSGLYKRIINKLKRMFL